jgi:hypothetical protein
MTDAEWRDVTQPLPMLQALSGLASSRKLRLYGAACLRLHWKGSPPDNASEALELIEGLADGVVTQAQLHEHVARGNLPAQLEGAALAEVVPSEPTTRADLLRCIMGHPFRRPAPEVPQSKGSGLMSALARLFGGTPARPVPVTAGAAARALVAPEWVTETVTRVASRIYDDRGFDRLWVLADALERAGCDNPDILAHCRGAGPHARGCWVVDAVLGKE